VYDRALDNCEIEQVNNYLGAKFGKDFSGFSAGYSGTTPFDNDVNALGISASDCGTTVTSNEMISAELIVDNPNSNDTENEFLIFANDRWTVDAPNTVDIPSGITARQWKAWRVEEETNTGWPADLGAVDVEFDLSQLGLTGTGVDSYVLLIDDDGVFTNASTGSTNYIYAWNNRVKFSWVDFDNGDFFAIAMLDTSNPSVTLNQASGQSDPETSTWVVNYTAVFSEPIDISSFTCSDISLSGTATAACTNITEVSGQNEFNVAITASTDGTILTLILPWTVTDVLWNDNILSNSSDNSVTVSGVFDSTPPVVPFIDTPTNFNPLTGTWEVWSTITIFSSTWAIIGTGTVSWSGTFSITPSPIPTVWDVDVTSTDSSGNTSTGTITTWQIDTTDPLAPTVNTPTNFNPLTGTWEVWAIITITNSGWTVVWTGTVDGSGNWSIVADPIPTTGTVNVQQTDSAGNNSPNTPISTGNIDTTPPTTPTVTTPTNFFPLTWTGEVGTTITIYNASGTVVWTGTVSGNGTFSIIPSPTPTTGPVSITS